MQNVLSARFGVYIGFRRQIISVQVISWLRVFSLGNFVFLWKGSGNREDGFDCAPWHCSPARAVWPASQDVIRSAGEAFETLDVISAQDFSPVMVHRALIDEHRACSLGFSALGPNCTQIELDFEILPHFLRQNM